jgi:hypothetical protein
MPPQDIIQTIFGFIFAKQLFGAALASPDYAT